MFFLIQILPADAGVSVVSGHLGELFLSNLCKFLLSLCGEVKSNRCFYTLRSPSNDVYVL